MRIAEINKDEPVSLYDQVAAELRRAIADGEVAQGERLPTAIDLAVLRVSKNTVIRALHVLRDESPLASLGGRGVRVTVPRRRAPRCLPYAKEECPRGRVS